MPDTEHHTGDELVVQESKPRLKRPSMYKVLLINDDYTPMDFVVLILEQIFGKDRNAATRIMMHVHTKGVGVCGIYTREVAETKLRQVIDFSQESQHPLQCTIEPESDQN